MCYKMTHIAEHVQTTVNKTTVSLLEHCRGTAVIHTLSICVTCCMTLSLTL